MVAIYFKIIYFRENYLFTCHCPKCEAQAGDLDVTSEDESDYEDEDEGGQ
jgi:hypothetical protein